MLIEVFCVLVGKVVLYVRIGNIDGLEFLGVEVVGCCDMVFVGVWMVIGNDCLLMMMLG